MSRLQTHYEAVREQHGYSTVDFGLGDASSTTLQRRFVAVDGREAVSQALARPTLVTTGVGMTGPPHLGTVGQIMTAVRLQEIGLDVQLVLADLEPYHGGADLAAVRRLAARYRSFIEDLGFDPKRGRLRTMEEATDVMHTAHLLARHYTPEAGEYWPDTDPTEWEQTIQEMYGDAETDESGPTSEAADAHSGMLHLADFLHPLLKGGYEQVVVMLGIDEHGLAIGARNFARAAGIEGPIAGLHARMITGIEDYPKMAKSVPESGVSLDMDPETIRERVLADDTRRPAESMVCQAVGLASRYDDERVRAVEEACAAGGAVWQDAKREYAESVCDLAERWRATAGVEYPDPPL